MSEYGSNGSTALIRLHSLGDVVLAQPAAQDLSRRGRLHFITSSEYIPVVERMEGTITPAGHVRESGFTGLRKLLRELSPDSVVDLQNSLTTRLATIGTRVSGRFRMNRGLRRRVLGGEGYRMPRRSVEFAEAAGVSGISSPRLARKSSMPGKLKVGLVTGGRWRMKSIPAGVAAETSRLLIDLYGAEVVLTGGPDEAREVMSTARSVMRDGVSAYAGEDGVAGLIGVLEDISLLISPDSGPAHLAEALGVPVLVVFTSTSPALGFWDPERPGSFMVEGLACRPCHRHGGDRCPKGHEACRRGILPLELARRAIELVKT